jgi:hypothetical protein
MDLRNRQDRKGRLKVEKQFKFSTTFHLSTYPLGQKKKSGRIGGKTKWKALSIRELSFHLSTRSFCPQFVFRFIPLFRSNGSSFPLFSFAERRKICG